MKIKNSDAVVKFFIDLSNKNAIKGVTELDKKSEALSRKFNQAGKALTIGLTTPIVAFGTYAVKIASDFDRASNQIQASLSLSTDKAKEFDNVLREMYTANYGESYEDLANKISYVAQATGEVDPSKIRTLTENAIALEETFGSDFNETIRGVTNLMTHFGISSEEAFDLFAKGSQLGLDYTAELGDNIAEYGGNFKQAGYSATEYFQLLSNGSKNGAYNLDKVNDSINEIKNRIGDGTIKENLSMFSSETKTIFENWENGNGTMKDVINSIVSDISNCTNEQKQLTMAATAFGTMGEDANLKVVTSLTTVGNEFNNVKGSMETLKEIKYDDLGSMLESLGRQFSDIALDIGNELMPNIQSFIGKIRELVSWFKDLDPKTKSMIGNIAKIVAVVGPSLIILGKLISIISTITNVLKIVKGAIMSVNTVLMANPIVLIIGAIIAVIAILVLAYQKCEWFRDGVNSVFSFIGNVFKTVITIFNSIIDFFKNNWQTILLFILNPFAGVFKILYDKFDGFRNFVNMIVESVKNFFLGLFNFIANIVTTIWSYIYNAFLLIVAIVSTILETIYNVISPIVGFIYNNILMPIFNFFVSVFTSIINFIVNFVSGVFNIFGTIAGWIYNNVLMPIFNFFSSVFNGIWNVISTVIDWITSGFSKVGDFVKTTFNNVKSFISNIFSTIGGVIKTPINGVIGLINGVLKKLNKIKVPDWVPGLGGKGINFPMIPKLETGTNYIEREGLAYLHEGEAVVPKKYNPAIGGYGNNYQPNITVIANMDVDKFGQVFVNDIKTFSNGAKNSYNFGGGIK